MNDLENEEYDLDLEINGKPYHRLEDLKQLSTGMLIAVKNEFLKEKLKTQKSYRMSTATAVLGGGCFVAGALTGGIISCCLGGFLIGRGMAQCHGAKGLANFYDKIVSYISDEIAYREFGKQVFPEFFPEETPKFPSDYNEFLHELTGL